MSAIGYGDELVRDYLLFRGFLNALKAFDNEVKADKDRSFRPDRIIEHLSTCIMNLDLNSLRESWTHLDQRFFVRLEHSFLSTAKKLEVALLRMYLVTCISGGRQDKLLEFFEKMGPELQGQSEWKDWFALPFIKNAEEHPTYSPFFSRQWQDTMLLSLHNFISVVFQSSAMPVILSYEEDLLKYQQLAEENEILKKKLAALEAGEVFEMPKSFLETESGLHTPSELMDDFFIIAQEAPPESSSRSIKSLIRNISGGLPTSPVLSRRPTDSRKPEDGASALKSVKPKPRSPSVPPPSSSSLSVHESTKIKKEALEAARSISHDPSTLHEKQTQQVPLEKALAKTQTIPTSTTESPVQVVKEESMSGFIILSREKYSEHNSLITHCKFNCTGTSVASSDMDGVIKIWNASPSINTISTIMSKTSVLSLEWDCKRERLLLYGGTTGVVRMYDTKERRVVKEIVTDVYNGGINQKVVCICCNPTGTNFVTSTMCEDGCQLSLWDMKSITLERHLLPKSDKPCTYCCSFNHNGQLLLTGQSDGTSSIIDLRTSEIISTWVSHTSSVLSTEFSVDETTCFTMGKDRKFSSWSVYKTGQKLSDLDVFSELMVKEEFEDLGSFGKRFCFNSDGSHVLTCGPLGGIIHKVSNQVASPVLDIGGNSRPVSTVDWTVAMESSTCICGTVDGKVIVSTLLNQ